MNITYWKTIGALEMLALMDEAVRMNGLEKTLEDVRASVSTYRAALAKIPDEKKRVLWVNHLQAIIKVDMGYRIEGPES